MILLLYFILQIDNFLFERPGQHLRVDGKITKESTDSCIIDLKNVDVQYVLDIVKFDDVEFGGLATGKVLLKNLLEKPDLKTRLNVHNFAVNKGLMGEADIKMVAEVRFTCISSTSGNILPHGESTASEVLKNISDLHVVGLVVCYKYSFHIFNVYFLFNI